MAHYYESDGQVWSDTPLLCYLQKCKRCGAEKVSTEIYPDLSPASLPPLRLDRGIWVCPIAGEGYGPENCSSLQQRRRIIRARKRAVARIRGVNRPVSSRPLPRCETTGDAGGDNQGAGGEAGIGGEIGR
jgi:hypothetical protein